MMGLLQWIWSIKVKIIQIDYSLASDPNYGILNYTENTRIVDLFNTPTIRPAQKGKRRKMSSRLSFKTKENIANTEFEKCFSNVQCILI